MPCDFPKPLLHPQALPSVPARPRAPAPNGHLCLVPSRCPCSPDCTWEQRKGNKTVIQSLTWALCRGGVGLPSCSCPTPWVLLAVANMGAPTSLSPTPGLGRPRGVRGWRVPPHKVLPGPGSDSFGRSGLCGGGLTWFSPQQWQFRPGKGFCSLPRTARGGRHSWSLSLHLIASGHKLAAKLPAPSFGFLEIQWPAWQAESQPAGPVGSAEQGPLHALVQRGLCSCAGGCFSIFAFSAGAIEAAQPSPAEQRDAACGQSGV